MFSSLFIFIIQILRINPVFLNISDVKYSDDSVSHLYNEFLIYSIYLCERLFIFRDKSVGTTCIRHGLFRYTSRNILKDNKSRDCDSRRN